MRIKNKQQAKPMQTHCYCAWCCAGATQPTCLSLGLSNTEVNNETRDLTLWHTKQGQEALDTNLSTSLDSVVLTNTELGSGT